MDNTYDLNSILNAIEDINKKKNKIILPLLDNFDKINDATTPNVEILPTTEKLILEAEEYSKTFKEKKLTSPTEAKNVLDLHTVNKDPLILSNQYDYNEENLEIINLEKIKLNIIDDLYSSLSKKVKRNTLKIIFDLRQKIIELEKELEVLSINKKEEDSNSNNHNINSTKDDRPSEIKEHLINEDNLEEHKGLLINENSSDLSEDVIKTLQLQESIIKNFEKSEEKLLLKIVDLKQDISLFNNNKKINISTTSKKENELIFHRENHERLIIEKNDIKKKLTNAKQQIVIFEQNIKELESAFENVSSILSKNSIININESSLKDPLVLLSSEESFPEPKQPVIHIVEKKPK